MGVLLFRPVFPAAVQGVKNHGGTHADQGVCSNVATPGFQPFKLCFRKQICGKKKCCCQQKRAAHMTDPAEDRPQDRFEPAVVSAFGESNKGQIMIRSGNGVDQTVQKCCNDQCE